MKLLVDELPKHPHECIFHKTEIHKVLCMRSDSCKLKEDRFFTCDIGNKDFECPYLKEFKAVAKEHYLGSNVMKCIPVELED